MNNISFGPYSKAIVAVVGAAATWAAAALGDNVITPQEWIGLVLALLTAAGVYQVSNAPQAKGK